MTSGTNPSSNQRTGGQVLVDQLRIHGVDMAFCVPGESYLGVLDALWDARDAIRLITTRNEIGACNMAEAYGKVTGRPGICLVTRGPGASHAMVGIHTAFQDSTPLILFVGQVAREAREREAFQEIDVKQMFGHTAKWAAEISDPRRIPEMLSHAFHVAMNGRPGPVVLALPEDMVIERCETADAAPYKIVRPSPSAAAMSELRERLAKAKRPLMLVGGGGWSAQSTRGIVAFAEANNLPSCASFRCQDLFDNRHRNYVGDCSVGILPALAKRIRETDLLLVVGARLGELTTQGYTLVEPQVTKQPLTHVHADANELGRVYQGELLIAAGMAEFAAAAKALKPVDHAAWDAWAEGARADYLRSLEPDPSPGTLDYGRVMKMIGETVPEETIMASDAGNFAGWLNRFYQFPGFRTLVGPTNGAMGYGVPAAIAAKLVHPERPVLCFAGDGGFMMTGQELATAVQYGANVVFLVINNGLYGTIRMYQEREYPNRYPATELRNPDFAAYARAFGAHGETVRETAEFPAALARALAAGTPAVIELRLDPEAITSRTTLTALRDAALARQQAPG
jgi:acetolactate synthase I/II/III large subunit